MSKIKCRATNCSEGENWESIFPCQTCNGTGFIDQPEPVEPFDPEKLTDGWYFAVCKRGKQRIIHVSDKLFCVAAFWDYYKELKDVRYYLESIHPAPINVPPLDEFIKL